MPTPTELLAVALPLVVGLALLALATLVLRKGGNHLHTRLFGALFLLSGTKSAGEGLVAQYARADGTVGRVADVLHASSPLFPDAAAWSYVGQACALAMLPLLFLFCTTFPHPAPWMRSRPLLAGALLFLPSVAMGALLFTANDDLSLAWGALAPFDLLDLVVGFNVLATAMTVTALVLLLRGRQRSPDHIERKQALYVVIGFLPSFAATWAIAAVWIGFNTQQIGFGTFMAVNDAVVHFVSPLFELVAAGLVGFAILKYNILGVNPKFRVGVKSTVVGFVFLVVFLVTQAIENIVLQGKLFAFAGEYGSFLLSGTTSIVLFKPIEKVSGKVSDRLLPRATAGDNALARAAEVYHAQCSYVLRDAQVSEREMAFLHNLRTQLGLSEAQARAIEEKVERLLKVDSPRTGATAGTAVHHVSAAHEEVTGSLPEVRNATPKPVQDAPITSFGATEASGEQASDERPPAQRPPAELPPT